MRLLIRSVLAGVMIAGSIGCASSPRFRADGGSSGRASPPSPTGFVQEGIASFYGEEFNGRSTSNGEVFDMFKFTAAHRTLPFGTKLRVKNLENGKEVIVRINDRGPFKLDRIIDLSYAAAKQLEMIIAGTARVKLEVVEMGAGKN